MYSIWSNVVISLELTYSLHEHGSHLYFGLLVISLSSCVKKKKKIFKTNNLAHKFEFTQGQNT